MTGAYSTVATVVRVTEGAVLPDLIIRLIIQTIRRDPTGSVQIDDPSNVSRPDPSGSDQIDAEHQATDLAVGGSNPSRAPSKDVHASQRPRWIVLYPLGRREHNHCPTGSTRWLTSGDSPLARGATRSCPATRLPCVTATLRGVADEPGTSESG
jgi:hypothetical protein